MCGIFGYVRLGETSVAGMHSINKLLNNAFSTGVLRGRDSTGLFCVTNDNHLISYKKAIEGTYFADLSRTQKILRHTEKYRCLIAHNRAATKGGVYDETSHPFTVGDITLVHNGTISNHSSLKYEGTYVVDSEAICAALAETEDVNTLLSKLNGAYVLIWTDARDNTLHLAKNSQRPLAYSYDKFSKSLVLASEEDMLRWLLKRNKIEFDSCKEFDNLKHYVWDLDGESALEYKHTNFKEFSHSKQGYYNTYGNSYTRYSSSASVPTQNTNILTELDLKKGQVIPFKAYSIDLYAGNNTLSICNGSSPSCEYLVECLNFPSDAFTSNRLYNGIVQDAEIDSASTYPVVVCQFVKAKVARRLKKEERAEKAARQKESAVYVQGNNAHIPVALYRSMTQGGCVTCGEPLLDPKKVLWDNVDNAFCSNTCMTEGFKILCGE